MKVLLLVLLVALVAGSASVPRGPHITKQSTDMVTHQYSSPTWERHIWVRNPLKFPTWVYIECDGHLTVNPIGVPDRRTSEISLPDVRPDEKCWLHHWTKQDGREPPAWRP